MESTIVVTALVVILLVPGLVWATVIAGLCQLTREAIQEREAALDELHRTV